jgi:hypothetical protein
LNHDRLGASRPDRRQSVKAGAFRATASRLQLDRLAPARRGLARRSRFEVSASTPFITDLLGGTGALADRNRSFACKRSGAILAMSRPRASLGVLPDDLYIQPEPWPRIGRPAMHDPSAWTVTDDWPDPVSITDAELDVFEAWFGDFFDELFGAGFKGL